MKQKRIEDGYYPCQKIKKSEHTEIHDPATQSAEGWLNAQTDPPKWYQPVTIKLKDNCILEGWARVTYKGDKEHYTSINPEIHTLIDAEEVVEWKYLPGHRSTTN